MRQVGMGVAPDLTELEALKQENEALKTELETLRQENEVLKAKQGVSPAMEVETKLKR